MLVYFIFNQIQKEFFCFVLGNIEGYFVVILTRREYFHVKKFEIIPYPGTNMERNLLIIHVIYIWGLQA